MGRGARFDRATDLRVDAVAVDANAEMDSRVALHWAKSMRENPRLFNGPLLSPVGVSVRNGCATLRVKRSDYAHYLYARSIAHTDGAPTPGTIFVSLVVPIGPSTFIAGRMAAHTATPGIVQLPGGGVSDLGDPRQTAVEEASEELGLDLHAEQLRMLGVIVRDAPLDVGVVYLAPRQNPAALRATFEKMLESDRRALRESEFQELLEFEVGTLDRQHPRERLVDYLGAVAEGLSKDRWHD